MDDILKRVQIMTTKADIIVDWIIRGLAVLCLTVLLFGIVVVIRRLAGLEGYDPYWIDYNAPGVDITSEGPDNDDPFYDDIPWHESGK